MKRFHPDTEHTRLAHSAEQDKRFLSRRSFLLRSGAALAVSTAASAVPLALAEETAPESPQDRFTPQQKSTLTTVTEHLFPTGPDSPGATDIRAVAYLETTIFQVDFSAGSRNFIINRVQSLHEASMERFALGFNDLDFSQRESLLRYLADHTRWGRNWISSLLTYILEALLSDPVYGGNPDGVGWRWLEHQPGFPRPPVNKIYRRL